MQYICYFKSFPFSFSFCLFFASIKWKSIIQRWDICFYFNMEGYMYSSILINANTDVCMVMVVWALLHPHWMPQSVLTNTSKALVFTEASTHLWPAASLASSVCSHWKDPRVLSALCRCHLFLPHILFFWVFPQSLEHRVGRLSHLCSMWKDHQSQILTVPISF